MREDKAKRNGRTENGRMAKGNEEEKKGGVCGVENKKSETKKARNVDHAW